MQWAVPQCSKWNLETSRPVGEETNEICDDTILSQIQEHFKVPSRWGLAFPEFQQQKKHLQAERGFTACPPLSSPQVNQIKEAECRWAHLAPFVSLRGERLGKERLRSFFGKSVSYDWERPSPGSSQLAWKSAHWKAIDPREKRSFSSRAGGEGRNLTHISTTCPLSAS